MKIFIHFEDNKDLIETKKYQSIKSLINDYLKIHDNNNRELNDDIEEYNINYNGKYLDHNLSLEKYKIKEDSILSLNKKIRGGNSFFSFASKYPYIVMIVFILVLIPLFILPSGFIPGVASLIHLIIDNSIGAINKYLVCVLGKKTLYSRIQYLLSFIKYIIYILMIYIIITFPLTLLCVTVKGHVVTDNPSGMCSPINTGYTAGMILTFIYSLLYIGFRFGNIVINFFINIFKKVYILNITVNPLLQFLLNSYDRIKYFPLYLIPFLGGATISYHRALDLVLPVFHTVLSTVVDLGCSQKTTQGAFNKSLNKGLDKLNDSIENNDSFFDGTAKDGYEDLCRDDIIECCSPDKFEMIADKLNSYIRIDQVKNKLIESKVYPIMILLVESFYEKAIALTTINKDIPEDADEMVEYFKNLLSNSANLLSKGTIKLIEKFIDTNDIVLIPEIKRDLDKNIPYVDVENINFNLQSLEELIQDYSRKYGSAHIIGKSLIKNILKGIFMNTFCNIIETSKSSNDIIGQLGGMHEFIDMTKSGSISGVITMVGYFIAIIVLVVMGIFDKY